MYYYMAPRRRVIRIAAPRTSGDALAIAGAFVLIAGILALAGR